MAKAFGREVRFVRIKSFERSSRPMVEPRLVDLTREHNCLMLRWMNSGRSWLKIKTEFMFQRMIRPFLIVRGEADRVVPGEKRQRLYESCEKQE